MDVGGHVVYGGCEEYELTPIGRIQAAAVRFVEEHGQPGVMHAPVALLLDFFAGWTPPRHLYTRFVYQVWGGMPYTAGDYLTHGVLGLLYPGYEDASYYRDERGFLAPTPFGDMADCLLSDAPARVLAEKLRRLVEGHTFLQEEGINARLGVSLGIATYPAEATTKEALIRLADKRMYEDKESRRTGR